MHKRRIPAPVREIVWRRDCGDCLDGRCFVCGQTVSYNNCHMAHVIPVKHGGGDQVDNLRVACQSCNLSMGTQNLYEFKRQYFGGKKVIIKIFISENCEFNYSVGYFRSVFPLLRMRL